MDTEEDKFLLTSEVRTQRQVSQYSQMSQMPIQQKQIRNYPKLQFNIIGQPDTSYFINSNANVSSFKSNFLTYSWRCPSPEERIENQQFYIISKSSIAEQSIKKYTRRKSCKGGQIFGEDSKQNTLREKQFPLSIINMHMKRIITEAAKKKKEKQKEKLSFSSSKRNIFNQTPKQQSFKNITGKSLFNSNSQVQSPLFLQNTVPILTQATNINNQTQGALTTSITQTTQRSYIFQPQLATELNQALGQKHSSSNLNNISEKSGSQKVVNESTNQNQLNIIITSYQNSKFLTSSNSEIKNNTNQKHDSNNRLVSENDDQNDSKSIKVFSQNFQNTAPSKIVFDEGNDFISKPELNSINSIKMDIEERKKTEFTDENDDNLTERYIKERPSAINIQNQKQYDKDSESSESINNDNDDIQIREDGTLTYNIQKLNKDYQRKNAQSKTESHRKETLLKLNLQNEYEGINQNQSQTLNQLPSNLFHRSLPKFSVINVVAPPISSETARKNYILNSKSTQSQILMSNGEISTKQEFSSTSRKPTKMIQNIKQIQENQDLQDIVQEYLEPGSTENQKYSPNEPVSRLGNMRKVFITATNMIALQNRVKANNSFFRNYYNLIGKVSVDNNIQYLTQLADEILSTPKNRNNKTIICAPKKRKVFIHNSSTDRVNMVSSLNKSRLNQAVQKYIVTKKAFLDTTSSNASKEVTHQYQSTVPSQFSQADYFINTQDSNNQNNMNKQNDKNKINQIGSDYIMHNNSNSVNRRIQDLQDYQQKQMKKNGRDNKPNHDDLYNLLSDPFSTRNQQAQLSARNSHNKSNSFQDKPNNLFSPSSNKQLYTPYFISCTKKSSSISKNPENKTSTHQQQINSKKCLTQRFYSSHNADSYINQYKSSSILRNSGKNSLHHS